MAQARLADGLHGARMSDEDRLERLRILGRLPSDRAKYRIPCRLFGGGIGRIDWQSRGDNGGQASGDRRKADTVGQKAGG